MLRLMLCADSLSSIVLGEGTIWLALVTPTMGTIYLRLWTFLFYGDMFEFSLAVTYDVLLCSF